MTTTNCGASRDDWDTLAILLGLGPDLLPVVSNQQATISPLSTLKDLGKTPSRYNKDRQAVGIPKWSQHVAADADIARWSNQPDYGICIITREVRAIDVDVPDPDLAEAINLFILRQSHVFFPRRHRPNSGKFLLAFRLPGDLSKRVIKVAGGIIEFLGTGQQFIAVGTHPSGVRYDWDYGALPDDFPDFSLERFEALWAALVAQFAIAEPETARAPRESTGGPAAPIDTATLRAALDAIPNTGKDELDYAAWLQVIMALHYETDASSDGLALAHEFSARSSKYLADEVALEWGRINGVTAPGKVPAAGGSILIMARKYGWSDAQASVADFAVIVPEPRKKGQKADPLPWPPLIRKPKTEQILCTMDNLTKVLARPDMTGMLIGCDHFREEIMYSRDDAANWSPFADADYTVLRIELERRGFEPPSKDAVRDAMQLVARDNAFDSAQLWLRRLKHDGVPRVEQFLSTYFGVVDSPYARAVSRYIWTAMAGRVIEPGCKADMAPILVGIQGARKSSALAAMVPHRDFFAEIAFSEKEDDLSRKMRGRLLCEIAELKGLHGKDSEAIKAWMVKQYEDWIPKYKEFATKFPRRSINIGTTNEDEFLVDKTGHRRWLPVRVGDQIDTDSIARDCDQLWAEGADLFTAEGIDFREAEVLARDEHAQYVMADEWEPLIASWLTRVDDMGDGDGAPETWEFLTTHSVLQGALNKDPKSSTRIDEMRVGTALRALGYSRERLRRDGRRQWLYVKTKT